MIHHLLEIAGLYVVGMVLCYYFMSRVEPVESWTETCALGVICIGWPLWLAAFLLKTLCSR